MYVNPSTGKEMWSIPIYTKINNVTRANKVDMVNQYTIAIANDIYYTCSIVKLINNINYGFWI